MQQDAINIRVVDPFNIATLVDKDNLLENLNSEMLSSAPQISPGVARDVIPVDANRLREMRFTEVVAGTKIGTHSHQGPIVRIITEGEAVVNGKAYKKGDWMVIPSGHAYEVETTIGYSAMWTCVVCF